MAKTHFSGPLYVGGVEVIDANGRLIAQTDLTEILDANDNEMLEFDTVASAVNFARLANAATGNNPAFSAQGDDTNIDLQLSSKGTGLVIQGDSGIDTVANGSATINTQRGVITTGTLSASSASVETFDLVNDKISADSQILTTIGRTNNTTGLPYIGKVTANTSGSATIEIVNASTTEAIDGTASINFVVLN